MSPPHCVTGSEEDRDAIASVAAECIKAHLHHEGVDVRTAALWVILNLTDGYDRAASACSSGAICLLNLAHFLHMNILAELRSC